MRDRVKQIVEDLGWLSSISETGPGVTRLGFTGLESAAFAWYSSLAREAGFRVRYDALGNQFYLRGRGDGKVSRLLLGSHLDSVPSGGRYDGTVGALLALQAVQEASPRHSCEIALFRCEESSRYGVGLVGSGYATGQLENYLDLRKQISFLPEIQEMASITPSRYSRYLEVHIEQGPVLENWRLPVGVVTGIAAPARYKIIFNGPGGHSGALPMVLRKDPVVAAAAFILSVQRLGSEFDSVATVGSVEVPHGSMNKVASSVELLVDLRSQDADVLTKMQSRLMHACEVAAESEAVTWTSRLVERREPALLAWQNGYFERALRSLGFPQVSLPSGAGHDALNIAHAGIPSEMLFLRSKGGVSHCPEEYTSPEDLAQGLTVLTEAIRIWDRDQDEICLSQP